jgi:hypothetical protein
MCRRAGFAACVLARSGRSGSLGNAMRDFCVHGDARALVKQLDKVRQPQHAVASVLARGGWAAAAGVMAEVDRSYIVLAVNTLQAPNPHRSPPPSPPPTHTNTRARSRRPCDSPSPPERSVQSPRCAPRVIRPPGKTPKPFESIPLAAAALPHLPHHTSRCCLMIWCALRTALWVLRLPALRNTPCMMCCCL